MKTVFYIAYGSNLNKSHFFKICPSAKILGVTLLLDKTLVFKGSDEEYSYLTIEEEIGSCVPVAVFEISSFDLLRLDKYEGYPMLYLKKMISLDIGGNSIEAVIYIMNNKYEYHLPSLKYFNSSIQGYEDFNLDKNYLIKALKITEEKRNKGR